MTVSMASQRRAAIRDRVNLALLLVLMSVCAWLLQRVGSWPHLPAAWPSWHAVGITLQGSYVPDDALVYLFTSAAWLLWLYLAFCIVINAVVVVAERLGPGGPWLEVMRAVASRATLPIVRRTVEAALVATFLLNVGTRSVPPALAASPSPVAAVVAPNTMHPGESTSEPAQQEARDVEYTVQPADTLWSIASRFYGSGTEYPRVVEANAGRTMPDGRTFTTAGVIHAGWKLHVPLPSSAIDRSDGQLRYIVQPGDCLSEIAARLLGDEERWPELYSANRNTARLPDGRVLTSPDLVWPGLPITLPLTAAAKPQVEVSPPAAQPPPPPAIAPVPSIEPPEPASVTVPSPAESLVPLPTAATPEPAASRRRPPLTLLYGMAGGLAAVGGGAAMAMVRRRRARRSLAEPLPLPDEDLPEVVAGFAEAELSRGLNQRLQGDELEPALVIAGQVARFLGGQELNDLQVLAVRYAGERASILLQCSLRDHGKLERALPDIERLFQCSAEMKPTVDRDVLLSLRRLKLTKLVSLGWEPAHSSLLIPVALLPQRETLYVDWAKADPAIVTGANASDVESVFVSLVAALAARRAPDRLRLEVIGSPQTLPGPFAELPHLPRGLTDQADGDAVRSAVEDVKRELLERKEGAPEEVRGRPAIVLAIAELGRLDASLQAAIETLALDGAANGVMLLAATGRPDAIDTSLIAEFRTQIVLRTLDEDQSTRVLGQPDAADLGSGGDLFVRVSGRTAMRGRGFRVSVDHLEELRRLMLDAGYPQVSKAPTPQKDEEGGEVAQPELLVEPTAADHVPLDEPVTVGESGSQSVDLDMPAEDAEAGLPVVYADVAPPQPAEVVEALVEERVHEQLVAEAAGELPLQESLPEAEPAAAGPSSHELVAQVSARVAARMGRTSTGSASEGLAGPDHELLEIRLLGEFTVSYRDVVFSPAAAGARFPQSWEILAFVAAQPNGMIAKEKLTAVMWPDVAPAQIQERLKQALHRLRVAVRERAPEAQGEFVRIVGGFCRLDTGVWCDVQQFVTHCQQASDPDRQAAKHAAVLAHDLYGGELLAEMPYSWLHDRATGLSLQERYRQDYCAVTAELARLFMDDGQPQLAVPLYKELLAREPTLEDVVRNLYRCYAATCNRAALVQEHRHLQEALTEMFNGDPLARPQPETIAVYQEALASLQAQAVGDAQLAASA